MCNKTKQKNGKLRINFELENNIRHIESLSTITMLAMISTDTAADGFQGEFGDCLQVIVEKTQKVKKQLGL